MKPIPLVRKAAVATAVSYLAAEGIPVHKYLQRANLSAPWATDLEQLVPLHQLCDFLSSVARAEGIDDLGFQVLGQPGMKHLGMYGRILSQALTLHEMIQITLEMISSYNSGLQIWVEEHPGQVRYCQKYVETLPRDRTTEVVHYGLASAISTARHSQGATWRPMRIELACDPVDLTRHFPEFSDLPIAFNQPQTSIWMNREVLSVPLERFHSSDCSPPAAEERQAFFESAPSTKPVEQLEQAIESVLNQPGVSLQLTASVVGASPRTLQRRLAERNTSFSRLLQGIRFRTAQQLLKDPDKHLKDISRRLGYTNSANFIRAFKRWTGVGPSEFRRLHYEHGRG